MPALQAYTAADLRRLRSVVVRPRGWSHRVKPHVREYRDEVTGRWVKVVTDEQGNKTRMRWSGQDAHVFLPHLRVDQWTGTTEVR